MLKQICAFIIFFTLPFFGTAQRSDEALNKLLHEGITKNNIPGAACAIIELDSIKYGFAGNTENGGSTAIQLNSPFHIGSNSKAITSYIAMRMVQDGIISLDDRFFKVMHDLKKRRRWRYRKITLEKLLNHTARIRSYTSGNDYKNIPNYVNELSAPAGRLAFASYVVEQKPLKKGMNYSNAGYSLASLMLERAAGIPFEKLVERYLKDIDMDYFYGFPIKNQDNSPKGHWMEGDSLVAHDSSHSYQLPKYMRSAGDFSMDIVSYSHFILEQLKGLNDSSQLLEGKHFQEMHTGKEGYSLAWGNKTLDDGNTISYHDGSAGTFYSRCLIDHKMKRAYILFTNTGNMEDAYNVSKLILLRHN